MEYYLMCAACSAAYDTIERAYEHQEATLSDDILAGLDTEGHGGFDIVTREELEANTDVPTTS